MNHLKLQQNQQSQQLYEAARAAGQREAAQIVAACNLAGKPELASKFIEKRMGLAAVTSALQAIPATDAQPAAADVRARFLAVCQASAGKERAALRARHASMRAAGVTVLVEV